MDKIRLIIKGYFQCSPDAWEPIMKTVIIENKELYELLNKGFRVIGSEVVKEDISNG